MVWVRTRLKNVPFGSPGASPAATSWSTRPGRPARARRTRAARRSWRRRSSAARPGGVRLPRRLQTRRPARDRCSAPRALRRRRGRSRRSESAGRRRLRGRRLPRPSAFRAAPTQWPPPVLSRGRRRRRPAPETSAPHRRERGQQPARFSSSRAARCCRRLPSMEDPLRAPGERPAARLAHAGSTASAARALRWRLHLTCCRMAAAACAGVPVASAFARSRCRLGAAPPRGRGSRQNHVDDSAQVCSMAADSTRHRAHSAMRR